MTVDKFDPLEYIEKAFDDAKDARRTASKNDSDGGVSVPTIGDYIKVAEPRQPYGGGTLTLTDPAKVKFKKKNLSAPRPRRVKAPVPKGTIDPDLQEIWQSLPKYMDFLGTFFDDSVTANYYRGQFKESRSDLIRRLLDPELTLEEVSRLLGVCPATVRRYTNRGWLKHHRTKGRQRRFRLTGVVKFVEEHGRHPEE